MKVGVLPDIHLNQNCHKKETERRVQSILKDLNDCDVVFSLGDVITSSDYKSDIAAYERFMDITKTYKPNFINLFGNNERDSEAFDYIKNKSGRGYGIYKGKNTDFIYLDTTQVKNGFYIIDEEQYNWFSNEISRTDNNYIILSHHPLVKFNFDDTYWFPDNPEKVIPFNRSQVVNKAREKRFVGSISGHVHNLLTLSDGDEIHVCLDTIHKRYQGDYLTKNHCIIEENDNNLKLELKGEKERIFEINY